MKAQLLLIGGDWHADKVTLPAKQHGEVIHMPKRFDEPAPAPAANGGYYTRTETPIAVEFDEYVAYLAGFRDPDGTRRNMWLGFHHTLGIDGETPIRAVFEFLLEHYVTHSDWADK